MIEVKVRDVELERLERGGWMTSWKILYCKIGLVISWIAVVDWTIKGVKGEQVSH